MRPSRSTLARVTVIRGEGPLARVPFIDEYICSSEPVVDYLTQWSGIHPGDLDPGRSVHHLVSLKSAYIRLRSLVDRGVVFVGHGLKKDFQMINIVVPPHQIVDTVDLFYLPRLKRRLGLRFLAKHLLNREIQSVTHNSVEDSLAALDLYQEFLSLHKQGAFGLLSIPRDQGHLFGCPFPLIGLPLSVRVDSPFADRLQETLEQLYRSGETYGFKI